jgi:hypothetical protein
VGEKRSASEGGQSSRDSTVFMISRDLVLDPFEAAVDRVEAAIRVLAQAFSASPRTLK